ncbi:MAG: hypothetical protein OEL75_00205 [Kiritimatiellaceae bacterium]|nr:hypothetical protein [Kiritimatiellaceae bacterium]
MPVKPTSLLGGESVYCINEAQLKEAVRLTEEDTSSAPRLQKLIATIEDECTRNERAALAFALIQRLRTATD